MADETEPAIPEDLVDLQRAWYAAEAAWVEAPDDRAVYEAFTEVGLKLYFHEHWGKVANRYKTTVELRKLARAA